MEHLSAYVRFNGSLVLEGSGEVLPHPATKEQVQRSYRSDNPSVTVGHSKEWWKKHAPKAAERMGW